MTVASKVIRGLIKGSATPFPDTVPPSNPAGLTASSVAAPVLSLTTASVDNVAVIGYEIWRRDIGASAKISTTASFPWTDSSASPSTTYNYKVRAYDAALNLSGFCAEASSTTPGGNTADVTAPPTPSSAPSLVSNGTGSITISLPLLTDPTVGGAITSGMQDYPVKINGISATTTAAHPSASVTFAAGIDIGSVSPAGTDSLVTGTYTLTAGGVQWAGISDAIHEVAGAAAGDFDVKVRITGIASTSGNPWCKAGLIVRDGSDPGAAYMALVATPSGMWVDFRAQAGAQASWSGAVLAHTAPYWGHLSRRGNVLSASISPDGSTLTAVTSQTVAISTSVSVGLAVSAQSAGDGVSGQTATGTFTNFAYAPATTASFVDTFTASATPAARLYTYAGRDNAGNVGAYSSSLSVTPTALTGGSSKKWNPGHFLQTVAYVSASNNNAAAIANEIAVLRSGPSQVIGYMCYLYWSALEPTTLGVYSFTALDSIYQQVTGYQSGSLGGAIYSSPKRLMIQIDHEYAFGTDPTAALPTYILANSTYGASPVAGKYGYWVNGGASAAAWWRTAVRDRIIALGQAVAAHVLPDGYTVDTSPYVEAYMPLHETAAGANASDPTYTATNQINAYSAIDSAMKASWPHTIVADMINYSDSTATANTLVHNAAAQLVSGYDGDVFGLTSGTGISGSAFTGLTWGQSAYIGAQGGADLRGKVPYIASIQSTELGDLIYYTPQDLFNQLDQTLHATHAAWDFVLWNTAHGGHAGNWWGTATSQAQWNTNPAGFGGVLYTITQNPLTHTSYPANYP